MKRKVLASLLVIAVVAGLVGTSTFALFSDVEVSSGNEFAAATLSLTLGGSPSFPIVLREMAPGVESAGQTVTANNSGSIPGKVNWEITDVGESDGSSGTAANSVDVSAADFAACVVVSNVCFDRNTNGSCVPRTATSGTYGCYQPGVSNSWTDNPCSGAEVEILESTWQTAFSDADRADIIAIGGWEGAPHPTGFDEWVLPDWARWGDRIHGNQDGKLTIAEIDAMASGSWNLDDTGGATSALDPGETYIHVLKFTLDDSLYAGNPNDLQADGIEVEVTVTLTQS